jgi:acetyltransferase-like isoleucine patch superfamily enzyme
MLARVLSAVISRLKSEEYALDSGISEGELVKLGLRRCLMLGRGMAVRPLLRASSGPLFLGRRVVLKSKRLISLGRSTTIGDYCYLDALSHNGIVAGDSFTLGRNSTIECTGVLRNLGDGIVIGDHVGISANAFIAVRGPVAIGSDTIVGEGLSIQAENHRFGSGDEPIRLQGETRRGVRIGRGCWLGARVTVLDGVTIGDGAVVAAGAVVTRDVPSRSVVAGVPARFVKSLSDAACDAASETSA